MSLFLQKISKYFTLDYFKKKKKKGDRKTVRRIYCRFHSRHQGESNQVAWVPTIVDHHLVILLNTYKRRCVTPLWSLCVKFIAEVVSCD